MIVNVFIVIIKINVFNRNITIFTIFFKIIIISITFLNIINFSVLNKLNKEF